MAHAPQNEVMKILDGLLEDIVEECEYSQPKSPEQQQSIDTRCCESVLQKSSDESLAIVSYISPEYWWSKLELLATVVPATNYSTDSTRRGRVIRKTKIIGNRQIKTSVLISDSEDETVNDENAEQDDTSCSIASNIANPETITIDSESSESDRDDETFEVEKICSARAVKVNGLILKQFLIKWTNYSAKTWVDELDLFCLDKLAEFYVKRGSSVIQPIAGATNDSDELNLDNWVTPDDILNIIKGWRNAKAYKLSINVAFFDGLETQDSIYLIEHNCHFYVAMHYYDARKVYISDGGNIYKNNGSVRGEIQARLGPNIEICTLDNDIEKFQDYCGSTAATLILTFIYNYKYNKWTNPLVVPSAFAKRMSKGLHKYRSVRLERHRPKPVFHFCRYCNKRFYKKLQLAPHERKCRARTIIQTRI